jgi:Flp pilus assembly pilin Flp
MKRRRSLLRQESGQGTAEYILILAVVVSILVGLLYNFNRSFREYSDAFFDTYIACLLEMGELPGTPNTICPFPEFPPPKAGPGGPGGSGGPGGPGDKTEAAKNEGEGEKDGSENDRSGNGEVTGRAGGGRGGRASSFGRSFNQKRSSTVVGAGKDVSETSQPADALLGGSRSTVVGRVSPTGKSEVTRMGYNVFADGVDEEKEEKSKPVVTGQKQASDALKPKKAIENLNRKPATKESEGTKGFEFGKMIRLLFIAGLIIAIVVFFGGQLLQISKSREKGG